MTEFRSKGKGKDRQVYPIKKRQPFGVTRNVAYVKNGTVYGFKPRRKK